MARAAAIMTESDSDDGAGGGAYEQVIPSQDDHNGLANLQDVGRGTDSRPEPQNQDNNVQYDIVDADDEPPAPRRDHRLSDEEGDGTLLDRRRREQQTQQQPRDRLRDETPAERRRRNREGRDKTFQENARMRAELEELRARLDGVEPRLSDIDQSRRQQAIDEQARLHQQFEHAAGLARRALAAAITEGNGEAVDKALEDRDRAMMAANQALVRKNMLETGTPLGDGPRRDQGQPQRQQQPDRQEVQQPRLSNEALVRVNEFKSENPWIRIDPVSKQPMDFDSKIAMDIDQQIMREGFHPGTDDYWDEMYDRMRQYLPHRVQAEAPEPRQQPQRRQTERQQPQQQAQQRPEQRGPRVGGGNDGSPQQGGRQQVRLTRERKEALISAGVLSRDGRTIEDRAKFGRLMKSFNQFDIENGLTA